MTIEFRCSNPDCGRTVRAPDAAAGRKGQCPTCGTVQIVPGPAGSLESLAEGPAAGPAGGEALCGDCGRPIAASAAVCPSCGWVNPHVGAVPAPPPLPPPLPGAPVGAADAEDAFGADCSRALGYAGSNIGSIFKLVICFLVAYGVFSILFFSFRTFLLWTAGGRVLLLLISLAVQLIIGGYFLRFYLDCIIGSLEGSDQAPDVPAFNLNELFVTGLKGLGMVVVYVLPVVTLPLLPIGYLALGYTNDARAFNVFRAARAATKRPGSLAGLWLAGLMWLVTTVGAVVIVTMLTRTLMLGAMGMGCFGFLLGLLVWALGAVVNATVVALLTTALFRCFGMLGRHYPEVVEETAQPAGTGVTVGCVAGGAAVSALMVFVIFPLVLLWTLGVSLASYRPTREPPARERPINVGDRYVRGVLGARQKALGVQTQNRLRMIAMALHAYAIAHRDRFPESLDELVGLGLDPRALRPIDKSTAVFVYVPGLTTASQPTAIIVYAPEVDSAGNRFILRISGSVESLPEAVFQQRMETQRSKAPPATQPASRPAPV